MPAAIPLVATGISAIGGAISSKKASNAQKRAEQAQQVPLAGMQQAGNAAFGQGQQLFNAGMPQMNQAAGYYSSLLNGSRAMMGQAVAPETNAITDVYRGAERSLERGGVRGAQRDVAKSDLARDQAGKIAGLLGGVRPQAADALGRLGSFNVSAGQQGVGNAGTIFGNMLSGQVGAQQQQLAARKYNDEQNEGLWGNIGKLLVDSYGAYKGRTGNTA